MRITLVTPAPAGSLAGNRTTALRWARLLRDLGARVRIATDWQGEAADVLIALHARKSGRAALRFRAAHPERPLVVALGGTEVYPDITRSALALRAGDAADRLVALQPLAVRALPSRWRSKTRVILQSADAGRPRSARRAPTDGVLACVLAHLRPVKDPFLPARASRLLPESSRIRVVHAGRALSPTHARRARREAARSPRWAWLGELPHSRAMRLLDT